MKKFFQVVIMTICLGIGIADVNAQVFNRPDFETNTVWIVRAGVGFNKCVGDWKDQVKEGWESAHRIDQQKGDFPSNASFDVSVAFNKSIKQLPIYWGMEMGISSRGYKTDAEWYSGHVSSTWGDFIGHRIKETESLTAYNVYLTPIMFGYKYNLLSNITLDAHIGGFVSYDFTGKRKLYIYDWSTSSGRDKVTEKESSTNINDLKSYRNFDAGLNLGLGFWYGHFNIDFSYQRGFIDMFDASYSMQAQSLKLRLGYAF